MATGQRNTINLSELGQPQAQQRVSGLPNPQIQYQSTVQPLPQNIVGSRVTAFQPGSSLAPRTTIISNLQQPPTIYGSQYGQSVSRVDPVPVFRAEGPPVPPLQTSRIHDYPLHSQVRPTTTVTNTETVHQVAPLPTVQSTRIVDGGTVYQSVYRDVNNAEWEDKKRLYTSSGYVDKKKSSPCCLALLGLLGLAALLTGLFFLIKAINAGAGASYQKPNDIDFKENSTSTNTSTNTNTNANSGPAVIDVNTNPSAIRPNTTSSNTTTTTYTTPTYTNGTNPYQYNGATTSNNTSTSTNSTVLLQNDQNASKIDKYLRQQDAYRLGNNPKLNNLYTKNQNGQKVYYYSYSTDSGKQYTYGVSLDNNNNPVVKSVNVSQSHLQAPRHSLSSSQKGEKSHRLFSENNRHLRT